MGVLLKLNFLQLELIQLEDLPVLESIAVRELMEGGDGTRIGKAPFVIYV